MHSVILFSFNRSGIGGWRLLAETIESRLFLIAGYGSYNPLVVMKTPPELGAEFIFNIYNELDIIEIEIKRDSIIISLNEVPHGDQTPCRVYAQGL